MTPSNWPPVRTASASVSAAQPPLMLSDDPLIGGVVAPGVMVLQSGLPPWGPVQLEPSSKVTCSHSVMLPVVDAVKAIGWALDWNPVPVPSMLVVVSSTPLTSIQQSTVA